MKKLTISLIAIALLFSACSKDKEVLTSKKSTPVSKATPKNRTFQDLNADGIRSAITTFQSNRTTYWRENTYPNFTQDEALQKMSLVLNYEKGLYGYYEDVTTDYYDLQITNNGKNEGNETILDGGSVFTKYAEIVEHLNSTYGDKKLYYATFTVLETSESYTTFRIHLIVGDRSTTAPNVTIYNDFPVIPVNTNPNCSAIGHPQYVAGQLTLHWNSLQTGPFAYYHQIGTIFYTNPWQQWTSPNTNEYLYHSEACNYITSYPWDTYFIGNYNSDYYSHINNERIARLNYTVPQKATYIEIGYDHSSNMQIGFKYRHYIHVWFASFNYIPDMFDSNYLPIIP